MFYFAYVHPRQSETARRGCPVPNSFRIDAHVMRALILRLYADGDSYTPCGFRVAFSIEARPKRLGPTLLFFGYPTQAFWLPVFNPERI